MVISWYTYHFAFDIEDEDINAGPRHLLVFNRDKSIN